MGRAFSEPGGRRPIRWWPAIAIAVIAVAGLTWAWTRDTGNTQDKVMPTFPILFFGAVGLFVWLVLFSRIAPRIRFAIFLGTALLGGLGIALVEIKGVDGNLVPYLGWRFAGERQFDPTTATSDTSVVTSPDDFPQIYGPDRLAVLERPSLARDWNQSPPRELWRRQVGEACSAFSVVGNAAVTFEQRGENEVVVRYDLRTGEQVWLSSGHAPFNTTVGGSGPRSTPTLERGRVHVLGATGNLICLDLATGDKIWSRNVLEDHDASRPEWGMASSPLVVGELVIVQLGDGATGIAAYDRSSGEPAWRHGDDHGTYTSPLLGTVAGVEQVLVVYRNSVAGHDSVTGEVLWQYEWPNPGSERITMPLVVDDRRLLVSAGYGVGSRMLEITRDHRGFHLELLWESRRLKSKFAPMVVREGVVYGLDDGVMVALDPETGERLWKGGRYGHGQFVLVDDLLLVQSEGGDVVLVEATGERHVELGRLSALSGRTWNPLALSGRLMLVRNDREAAVYELETAQ